MLSNELTFKDIFESSGVGLRMNSPKEFEMLKNYLSRDILRVERVKLTASPDGILERLYAKILKTPDVHPDGVAMEIEQLAHILNGGGKLHETLGLCAAAWLLDKGLSVQSEAWVNGKRDVAQLSQKLMFILIIFKALVALKHAK